MAYGQWDPYVSAATRKAQVARTLTSLRKAGQSAAPVRIEGRAIAKTFWGKAWCDNLESYRDVENRLPRGRTHVRNGSVLDLQITPSVVTAMVMGSSLYRVSVRIARLPAPRWATLCRDCAGGIDSLVELLQGRFSTGVMERLCRQEAGLFPKPSEITLSCTCPDYSEMCKHVAAALYGVGARLDAQPELLFRLRSVDEREMVGRLDGGLGLSKPATARRVGLDSDDLSSLFGIDIVDTAAPSAPAAPGAVMTARERPATRSKAAQRSTGLAMHRSAKEPSQTEGPVRYLTVKEALRRSGKTPTQPKTGTSKRSQTRPAIHAAPKGAGIQTSPARRKPMG